MYDPKQDPAPAFSKSFVSGSIFGAQASEGHMLNFKNVFDICHLIFLS